MAERHVVGGRLLMALAVAAAWTIAGSLEPVASPPPASSPKLDEGLLDPAWFGAGTAMEFRETPEIDYLWVKPGFELPGKRAYFEPWAAPRIPTARDGKDEEAAAKFTADFPAALREALSRKLSPPVIPVTGSSEAEVVLAGRVADCNAGNSWAYVPPATTIDIRILDARTGELLAAVHNRKVGRTQTSLHSNVLVKLFKEGLQETYAGAKPAKD